MSVATIAEPKIAAPPRRWGLRLLLVVGILFLLVWAAPIFACYTPLVTWACDQASAAIGAKVAVGTISLGWFSPIVLSNVELRDADDRPIVQIPRIEGDRSLLSLALDRDNLGNFQIKKPKIDIVFAGKESNLEKLLAKSLSAPTEPKPADASSSTRLPQVRMEVVDATVAILDADTGRHWPIRALSLSAICFTDGTKSVQISAAGELTDGVESGTLKADVMVQDAGEPNARATVKARFSSFPLSLGDVILRRYQAGTQLTGSLQGKCDITASLQEGKPSANITSEWIAHNVTLVTPKLADPLCIERMSIPCRLRLADRTLIADSAEVDCDFGKLAVHGSLDLDATGLAALDRPDFDLSLDVSVAKIAERLPKTLHLHRDLRLVSGNLKARCTSSKKDGDVVWQANMRAADVRGMRGQQAIAWTEPIALDFQARNLAKGMPLIDHLHCSARFLQIEGSSGADQFTLTAQADLQELAAPLSQFIDLGGVKLAGRCGGTLQARRLDKENYLLHGDAQLKQVNLAWLTQSPWQEDLVEAKFDARARIGPGGKQEVDAADVEIKLGGDVVALQLSEPISDLATGPGSASLRLDGDLARWQKRAAGCTTLFDDCRLAGQMSAQAQVRSSSQGVDCSLVRAKVDSFRCTSANLAIQEPSVSANANLHWDAKSGQIAVTQAKVSCPSIELQADALSLEPATLAMRGNIDFAGNIDRLHQWMHDPSGRPAEPMAGTVAGRLNLQAADKHINAGFDVAIKDLIVGAPAKPAWREAEVKCVGVGSYDPAADIFRLDKIHVASAAFSADAAGSITQVCASRIIDLTGTLAYDLAKMEPQLRPILGKDVKIVGKDARSFKLAGPLFPKEPNDVAASLHWSELKGEASVSWNSLHGLGCDVGPAEAKAIVQQGWLQLFPIETTLNGGKLRLQPNVRLEPGPTEMIFLAGPIIEKAKITPELCAGALGYAMPLLANVAQAEGALSLSLDGGRVPLSAPATSEIKGTIVLHSATIEANPALRELAKTLKLSTTTGLVKECRVPFQMSQGKGL